LINGIAEKKGPTMTTIDTSSPSIERQMIGTRLGPVEYAQASAPAIRSSSCTAARAASMPPS
jgi:hypothetical protein